MAKRDLKSVIYTSDDARNFATKIDAALFAQVGVSTNPKVGGADYTGTPALTALPAKWRPRAAVVSEATHGKRYVVCLDKDADLYTGVETTVTLAVLGAAPATFTRIGIRSENGTIIHDPAQ